MQENIHIGEIYWEVYQYSEIVIVSNTDQYSQQKIPTYFVHFLCKLPLNCNSNFREL